MSMLVRPRFDGLWRHADFVKLWAGSTTSQFGSMLGALSFLAVVTLDATPLQMGVLAAVGVAPGVLFGFIAGVWVDRVRRRPVLISTDLARAVSVASLAVAYALGGLRIEHLYLVAFINGTLRTFFDVSFGAYVPALVGRDNLVEANSKLAASESVVEASTFSIGGWIVQLLNATVAVVIDAFTFLFSALFLIGIRTPESASIPTSERHDPLREVWHGLKFTLDNLVLRALFGIAVAEGLQHGIVGSIILIYGVRELGFETGVLATIFAVGGVSSFVGATFSTKITRRFGVGPTLIVGFLLFGLGALLLPLARGPLMVAGTFLMAALLFDASYTVYGINEVSLRQAVTPDHMLGRVTATVRFIGIGAFLLGSLMGGALAGTVGLRWTLVLGGASGVMGAAWLFVSPVRTIKDVAELAHEDGQG